MVAIRAGAVFAGAPEVMRFAARRALWAGVTTVRDLGDRAYLAVRIRDEVAEDPD